MALLKELKRQLGSIVNGEESPRPQATSPYTPPSPKKETGHADEYKRLKQEIYTGGFESIYALENVDLSTVRPMGAAAKEAEAEPSKAVAAVGEPVAEAPKSSDSEEPEEEGQLELDLGESYRGWMPSFRLREPIQSLGLSSPAEKALLEGHKSTLGDLIEGDLLSIKGLGQGHIDEIQKKRDEYLGGSSLQRCRQVDFVALLRSLLGAEDRKHCCLALEPYGLSDLFPLIPADEVELRHLSPERRIERREAACVELGTEKHRRALQEGLVDIANVFLKPWIQGRLGLATEVELRDRLQRISSNPDRTAAVLRFFSDVYFEGQFPFRTSCIELAKGLYSADRHSQRLYRQVVDRARSYFYHSRVRYNLDVLSEILEREFAKVWQGFPDGFLVKVLRLSPDFRVRKGEEGRLMVRQAQYMPEL